MLERGNRLNQMEVEDCRKEAYNHRGEMPITADETYFLR